jgi:pimeloyl-ACP methyl ester carboxylesterase
MIRLGLALLLATIYGCSPMIATDNSTDRFFKKRGLKYNIELDSIHNHMLRWVQVSPLEKDTVPIILFVHGASGSANNFYQFLADSSLLKHARLISVDRLGYSPYDQGESVVSIQKQSDALAKVLTHYQYPWLLIVGHSYGGPIVANYTLDYPEKIKAAILLAPALDPENEKVLGIAKLTEWKATKWMIPDFFMVAADEKNVHVEQLKLLLPKWETAQVPFVHLHGTKDGIVPYENTDFSKRVINEEFLEVISIENGNHLLPWSETELIKKELLRWVNK